MTAPPAKLNPQAVAALQRAVSTGRFAAFSTAAAQDRELACRLYLWDRDLAAAILRDIAIVEVALRNTLSAGLIAHLGPSWFTDRTLRIDRRLDGALTQAIDALARVNKPRTSDRIVAELSLGFWVNLLDARGSERFWRASLHQAFPGGRAESAAAGARFQRSWVLTQLRVMRFLRNRCAHHEPLINGVPLPGQAQRVTVTEGITTYLRLTRMIDRNLADWMTGDSTAAATLTARPQPVPAAPPKVQP